MKHRVAAKVTKHRIGDLRVGMCVGQVGCRIAHAALRSNILASKGNASAYSAKPMNAISVQPGNEMPNHCAVILAQLASPRSTVMIASLDRKSTRLNSSH